MLHQLLVSLADNRKCARSTAHTRTPPLTARPPRQLHLSATARLSRATCTAAKLARKRFTSLTLRRRHGSHFVLHQPGQTHYRASPQRLQPYGCALPELQPPGTTQTFTCALTCCSGQGQARTSCFTSHSKRTNVLHRHGHRLKGTLHSSFTYLRHRLHLLQGSGVTLYVGAAVGPLGLNLPPNTHDESHYVLYHSWQHHVVHVFTSRHGALSKLHSPQQPSPAYCSG